MERNDKIRNLVLVIIGMFALFLAFGGTGMIRSAGFGVSPEVKTYAERTLVPMDSTHFRELVAANKGKPMLMFVYASWCPWCKKQFPMIKALQMRFGDDVHFAYVSIDDDSYALSRFLMKEYPKPEFTPYHVSEASRSDFYGALAAHGFTHSGSIPYLILTTKDGGRAAEFRGLTEIPVLRDAIKKAM